MVSDEFIRSLPKAELHVHVEGTLEPEMMFAIARRNGIELPYRDVEEVRQAYRFTNLQSFLDIYYDGAVVFQTPADFYDLMTAYLDRAAADGVRRAEIFFDPQAHTSRGVGFGVIMAGFRDAIADAGDRVSAALILCFLRHLGGEEAVATIREAEPHLEGVIAVGLDSSEAGHPPELFEQAYAISRSLGLRAVAHAGEEGPPEYIWQALDVLGAERIDHGVRCLEDPGLVARLVAEQVPLTVCPLSNLALRVVPSLADHPLPLMLEKGLMASVHSDDPAYFGGYVGESYRAATEPMGMTEADLVTLARNSITSSFLPQETKDRLLSDARVGISAS